MKKHRKLVALLVALTFLFSVVAPAMAADAADPAQISADKLNVLGIIEGYPDGSFGLDRNITRAEFAKIAVATAGLTEAAEQLVNFPSQFSDVATGEWYTGWINMAASQGFVKGDPAGTFRPNDNITYAEVVTVLVRLLGYDDNLRGPWPTNYLAKAVELDITEGVAINASAPAVRGDVFIMTDNALDCYTVKWSTEHQDFENLKAKLIVKSFKGQMDEALVTDINWDSRGNIILSFVNEEGKTSSAKLVSNVIVTGADDAYALLGKQVEYIKSEKSAGADTDDIVYLGLLDTDSVSKDKATFEGRYIVVDKKKYEMARGFDVTFFPEDEDWDEEDGLKGDKVEVVLNENGEAQWAFVYNFTDPDVVEEIASNRIYGKVGGKIFETDSKKVQVFVRDGVFVELEDLAEGDLVYVVENAKNADHLVIAVSEVLEGELKEAHSRWETITVDGKKLDVDLDGHVVSDDGGDTYNASLNDDMFDDVVSYMLSPAGRVAVVISGSIGQNQVGVIEYAAPTARGVEVRIVTPDGTKAIYYVDSDYSKKDAWKAVHASVTTDGEVLVEYSLDKNGRIDEIVNVAIDAEFADYDGKRAELDVDGSPRWYRVDSNAGFFGYDSDGKLVATDWDTFKRYAKADDKQTIKVLNPKGSVKAMYVADKLVDVDNIGVIASSGRDGGKGKFFEIFVDGERIRYNLTSDNQSVHFANGTPVVFSLTSGKISAIKALDSESEKFVYGGIVAERGSDYLKIDSNFYYMDEDTMIIDATGSSPKLTNRVGRGDKVELYSAAEKGIVELVVITKEPATTPPEPGLGDGGTVTYINADGMLLIDGEAYQVGAATVLYNEKGTVIAVGATAINTALAQNDEVKDVKVEKGIVKSLVGVSVASEIAKAQPVINAIAALATSTDLDNDVPAARALYNELTNSQKDLVTNYDELVAAEAALGAAADLEAAQTAVEALFDNYATKTDLADGVDQAAIDAAEVKVNKLADTVTEKADLLTDIAIAQGLLDAKLAGEVDTLIEAGLETFSQVEAARAAFDALTDAQQALVKEENVIALETAETAVADAVKAVNEATNYSGLKAALTTHATILDITVPTDDLEIIDLFNMLPFADAEAIHDAVTNL